MFCLQTVIVKRAVKVQQFLLIFLLMFRPAINCLFWMLRGGGKAVHSPSCLILQRGWHSRMFSHRRSSAMVRQQKWCVMSLAPRCLWWCGTTRTKRSLRSTTVSFAPPLISRIDFFHYISWFCFFVFFNCRGKLHPTALSFAVTKQRMAC